VARYPSSNVGFAIGPGGISPAVKILIIANVVLFALNAIVGEVMTHRLGLSPVSVFKQFAVWQPLTYMFLHGGVTHVLFNMLALWMFGTELERMWGTRFFVKYYLVTGVGAALVTLAFALFSDGVMNSTTIGASGAIYGILVAYAIYFPHRTIYYIIFPMPARVYVLIAGVLALMFSASGSTSGTAHWAHLGGLVIGYLYLKGLRLRLSPWADVKYRYLKWKMGRARSRFDVYSGGRRTPDDDWKSDWKKHIH
jgi:membrane associated rhomboid family serine protease